MQFFPNKESTQDGRNADSVQPLTHVIKTTRATVENKAFPRAIKASTWLQDATENISTWYCASKIRVVQAYF